MPPPKSNTLQTIPDGQADRADTTMENLCLTLVEFLTYVLQAKWNSHYPRRATEQANPMTRDNFIATECEEIAFDRVE